MDKLARPVRRRRAKTFDDRREEKFNRAGRYYSKSIGRALDVLECFCEDGSSLSLREIGEILRLPEPSLFRILFTLQARKYLVRKTDGAFGLSSELMAGRQLRQTGLLSRLARPALQKLVGRFNETTSLAYLFEDRIQVVDTCETFHEIRVTNIPGRLIPPHCSSLGKAITAFQNSELMERIIEVYGLSLRTPNTIVDRQRLIDEFARVRVQGFATDREECMMGGICIGAPIRLRNDRVGAAVSVSSPKVRFSLKIEEEMIQAVKDAAKSVEENLRKQIDPSRAEPDKTWEARTASPGH